MYISRHSTSDNHAAQHLLTALQLSQTFITRQDLQYRYDRTEQLRPLWHPLICWKQCRKHSRHISGEIRIRSTGILVVIEFTTFTSQRPAAIVRLLHHRGTFVTTRRLVHSSTGLVTIMTLKSATCSRQSHQPGVQTSPAQPNWLSNHHYLSEQSPASTKFKSSDQMLTT